VVVGGTYVRQLTLNGYFFVSATIFNEIILGYTKPMS